MQRQCRQWGEFGNKCEGPRRGGNSGEETGCTRPRADDELAGWTDVKSIVNMECNLESKYSGQCLCGEIVYSVDVEPLFSGNCHCKDCQRSSGSAFIPALVFLEKNVSIIGQAKYFESLSDSGSIHTRGFCSNCGSQLFAKFSAMPGMLGIKAGTLDNPSYYVPKLDFHVASAAPWDFMNPELPKKAGPPQS